MEQTIKDQMSLTVSIFSCEAVAFGAAAFAISEVGQWA